MTFTTAVTAFRTRLSFSVQDKAIWWTCRGRAAPLTVSIQISIEIRTGSGNDPIGNDENNRSTGGGGDDTLMWL
jgi:hypothetical protein